MKIYELPDLFGVGQETFQIYGWGIDKSGVHRRKMVNLDYTDGQ